MRPPVHDDDDPDSLEGHHFLIPLPLPERKLMHWVEELQSHSDTCKLFGFSLSTGSPTAASTTSERTAPDPLKEPEETPQRLEGILAVAKAAEESLATTIEETIRNNTDSVSCPSSTVSN
jgi:hypothetical protein